ncbi:Zn-dependent exopeptidase M28 [candidate division WOR-3 bacterium]|nr:Zn-dependent exopeptidase M28 [candidate division WOR-3 bacterium]
MKCVVLVSALLAIPVFAGQLALLELGPADRGPAVAAGLEIYRDFGSAVLVDAERLAPEFAGRARVVDAELAPGEYFLQYRGAGNSRVLWRGDGFTLVRMTESEALAQKATGALLEQVAPRPYVLRAPAEEPVAVPLGPDTTIRRLMDEVSLDSLHDRIRELQNFGTRYSYYAKCESAAQYLYRRFSGLGLDTRIDTYYLRQPTTRASNVEVTLPGAVVPESIVVACGHFDSYCQTNQNNAPGADDNATGTAALLELARILKDARLRWTVKLLAFSGEEQWMKGSYHWVDSVAVPAGMKIGGVYNIDMVGYTAADTTRLVMNTNTASRGLAVLSESVNVWYDIGLRLINYLDEDCAGDNTPFWERGYRSVFALEDSEWGIWNGSNPHYHTTHDTIGFVRMGQVFRTTQLALGCMATLSGLAPLSVMEEARSPRPVATAGPTVVSGVLMMPAPAAGSESACLLDATGRKVLFLRPGRNDVSRLAPGIYFVRPAGAAGTSRVVKVR